MKPRSSALPRSTALRLAATEYERCAALFRKLQPADWSAQTDCPAWDVRQMASHMLGMVEMAASVREGVRQQVKAARAGGGIDALTALQVAERSTWSPEEITERFAQRARYAVRGRRRIPTVLRKRTMPERERVNGADETWTFGYLFDVILTRDPWMHRIDISRATQAPLELTPDHDGVIVADVVAEWADRHGKEFDLTLTGPAGGHWVVGLNGPHLTLDAVDFCRVLAGRPGVVDLGTLMSTQIPF
jgi:uncharacterized protein (TIGR03083 family)